MNKEPLVSDDDLFEHLNGRVMFGVEAATDLMRKVRNAYEDERFAENSYSALSEVARLTEEKEKLDRLKNIHADLFEENKDLKLKVYNISNNHNNLFDKSKEKTAEISRLQHRVNQLENEKLNTKSNKRWVITYKAGDSSSTAVVYANSMLKSSGNSSMIQNGIGFMKNGAMVAFFDNDIVLHWQYLED